MNRVDRLLGYLLIFQGKELVRAQDLAERFEVSERTVYRDVDALCELGVPLYGVAGEGYRLMDGYYLPPIMFAEEEARALFLATAMLTSFTPEGKTQDAAQSAVDKIRAVLPESTLNQVEALQSILGFYAFGRPPLNLDDPKFTLLQQAIQNRQVIKVNYHAMHSNEVTERSVEPLHLAYVESAWILSGFCHLRKDVRNFRLDRMDAITVTSEIFDERPTTLKREEITDGTDVIVRFQPEVVRWVREAQHFTFRADLTESYARRTYVNGAHGTRDERGDAPDGSVVMVYHVRSREQIIRWLTRWGSSFEVLEPSEFRTEVQRIAIEMATKHGA